MRTASLLLACVFGLAGLHVQVAHAASAAPQPSMALPASLVEARAHVDAALAQRKAQALAWQKAVAARDQAAARVTSLQAAGGAALDRALRMALEQDAEAARARSALLAAESALAQSGAALLRAYDATLAQQRVLVDATGISAAARAQAVTTYRALAQQRDSVRDLLRPVLADGPAHDVGASVEARSDDDVEALLEKADLARDLEDRARRRLQSVHKRIQELQDEATVSRGVRGLVQQSELFDEDERRLVVTRSDLLVAPQTAHTTDAAPAGSFGGTPSRTTPGGPTAPTASPSTSTGAPPPNGLIAVGSNDAQASTTSGGAPAALARTEQTLTPTRIGTLSTSTSSPDDLRALQQLEAQLNDEATRLHNQSAALRKRAHDHTRN